MKYVKCINPLAPGLTYNKIYEVKKLFLSAWSEQTFIDIINDQGGLVTYNLSLHSNNGGEWFEDATAYIRDNKLNELGI